MTLLIVDSGFGEKRPKLSRIVLIFDSGFSGKWPKLSMIVLIVDSGFGGKGPKLSMIVLIFDSGFGEKWPKISMIVLIVDSAESNFHLKLSLLPPPPLPPTLHKSRILALCIYLIIYFVIFSETAVELTKWAQTSPADAPHQVRQLAKFALISSSQVPSTKKS